MKQDTQPNRAAYRVSTVADMLDVSRVSVYRLAKTGELQICKTGLRSSGVTGVSLVNYLQRRGIPVPAGL